jgi:hypothetical protein
VTVSTGTVVGAEEALPLVQAKSAGEREAARVHGLRASPPLPRHCGANRQPKFLDILPYKRELAFPGLG